MKEMALPNFTELDLALSKTTLKLHPSQAHGLICGIICGNPSSDADWEALIVGGGKESEQTHKTLRTLYQVTAKQLNEFLFELQMVLPEEAESLPVRAEALTMWCQGVLTGLKIAHVQIAGREPGELTEAINDLIEIAKMNYEEVVASEEDEEAYTELVEYVRMAMILIYQSLRESDSPVSATGSIDRLH